MHTIHHTPAVILKSVHFGEANKRVWLLTKEFGLIVAAVQGVRKAGAKLQGHLVDYAFINADLVRGKEVWRLISCELLHNPLEGNPKLPLARSYVRTLTLLERFLLGEGDHVELYAHVTEISTLISRTDIDERLFDTLSLWRAIAILGYIAVEEGDEELLHAPFDEAIGMMDDAHIRSFITVVNASIKESQL